MARPAGFAAKEMLVGVVPPGGVTVSHGVVVLAVKAPGVVAETVTVWVGGGVPVDCTEKLICPGFKVNI